MVRRTHTIGVVLRSHPETVFKPFLKMHLVETKVAIPPADNENGPAMTTNSEAHGMVTWGGP